MKQQNILISDLFSNDLRKRYEYSVECFKESNDKLNDGIKKGYPDWPNCWFGSANAWLVFLGPSRGNSPRDEIKEENKQPTIGHPNDHFKGYKDKRKFWENIRDYTEYMFKSCNFFEEDSDCYSMALVANVIDSNEAHSRNIKKHVLETGMRDVVYNKLELIKPKVIIALTIPVQEALINILHEKGVEIIELQERNVMCGKKPNPVKLYQLKTSWGNLIVSRTPKHPSWGFLCNQEKVKEYLSEVMKLSFL